jgi:nitrate reductase gamma subunit
MAFLIGLVFPYIAIIIFLGCSLYRTIHWERLPHKLDWRLYPVPKDFVAQTRYMVEEWISFKMLFHNNRLIWVGSYLYHLGLLAAGIWFVLFLLGLSVPVLIWTVGFVLLATSSYLLLIRALVPHIKAITEYTDYFNLILFILIPITGLIYLAIGDAGETRTYFRQLIVLHPVMPPKNGVFLAHLLLLEFFLAYLPFSKMFHVIRKYFTFHKLRWTNPYAKNE